MKVIVKTLDRNVVDVTVEDDSTLFDLKKSIQEIKNHPAEQMTIIFQGKKLEENDKVLSKQSEEFRPIGSIFLSPKVASVYPITFPNVNRISSLLNETLSFILKVAQLYSTEL